jgi:hypothetical protein
MGKRSQFSRREGRAKKRETEETEPLQVGLNQLSSPSPLPPQLPPSSSEHDNMPNQPLSEARSWIILLGLPALLVGLGVTMTGYLNFWLGVCLAFFAICYIAYEWWFFSKKFPIRGKALGWAAIGAVVLSIGWLVFRPVPIDADFLPMPETYPDGTNIGGIQWQKRFSQVRVILVNHSAEQYTNIDLRLRTNLDIAAVGFVSDFSTCGAKPLVPGILMSNPTMTRKNSDGSQTTLPMDKTLSSTVYRAFCDRLLAGEKLEVVLGLVPKIGQDHPDPSPTWISVRGSFDGLGRPRSLDRDECLVPKCQGMTAP